MILGLKSLLLLLLVVVVAGMITTDGS